MKIKMSSHCLGLLCILIKGNVLMRSCYCLCYTLLFLLDTCKILIFHLCNIQHTLDYHEKETIERDSGHHMTGHYMYTSMYICIYQALICIYQDITSPTKQSMDTNNNLGRSGEPINRVLFYFLSSLFVTELFRLSVSFYDIWLSAFIHRVPRKKNKL